MGLNWIQKIGAKLFAISIKREVVYQKDPELVEQNRVAIQRLQTLEAQLAKRKAQDTEIEEKNKEQDENLEIAQQLSDEEEKLKRENLGELISLNKFFAKIYGVRFGRGSEFGKRTKFGKKLEIADKNDEMRWKFGEINISTKGFWVITDLNGIPRIIASDLRKLIHKPESLNNQLKSGRILLAVDRNGRFIPELDDIEVEVPVWNEAKENYELSEKLREKARTIIMRLKDDIREQDQKIESQELVIGSLKRESNDLRRAKFIYETNSNIAQTETSKAIESSIESSRNITEMMRNTINLTEDKVMLEKRLEVVEGINEKLLNMLEQTGDKTEYRKAEAHITEMMEKLKLLNPEKEKEVIQLVEKPIISQKGGVS